MDKKKSLINIVVAMGFKAATMLMAILVKRVLIKTCGNEVNGLNALYLSIIGFMSVAELGIGSAITFCMYKPVVEGDCNQVSALYGLFRRLYLIIGAVIFTCGVLLTPFIHLFARDYTKIDVNLHTTFLLMLISTVLTYLFSAKTALFNAYKNNYITTAITYGGVLLQYILQIIALSRFRTFESYLACRIVACLAQWLITEIVAHKKHYEIISKKNRIDVQTRKEITKSIKAMFMHKVGILLVNTLDSVIIAAFVGVIVLGEYSNYTTILASATGILKMVFSSLTSIFGHLYVQKDKRITKACSEVFHYLNFAIGTAFFLGYYAIIDNLIAILFAAELVVDKSISFVITLNGFIQFMRESTLAFRDATGTFYYDRWKPLLEGVVNIALSIVMVKVLGVTGVIVATIATNLLVCHIVEPYVLYKHAFEESPKVYLIRNYLCILLFTVSLVLLNNCLVERENPWIELLTNGMISVAFSAVFCFAVLLIIKRRSILLHDKKRSEGENGTAD